MPLAYLKDELSNHAKMLSTTHLKTLFRQSPTRFQDFSIQADSCLYDFSKVKMTQETLSLLIRLADKMDLHGQIEAMFNGQKINQTENRAVLHTALRATETSPLMVDGINIRPQIQNELSHMTDFCDKIRNGQLLSSQGQIFTDIVNIGIGGSDLGPVMAYEALAADYQGPKVHFVSNIDPTHLFDTLAPLSPASTLIIIASKTFTTLETMTNAHAARHWIESSLGSEAIAHHFVALSTNLAATSEFGIPESHRFGFWDWVGGRYSIWSAIGLSLMLAIGPEAFQDFLRGATRIDTHFKTTPFHKNIPVMMGLIGYWHRSYCHYPARAIIPYAQRLHRLPAYLQQLDMESNGKSVCLDGQQTSMPTGPILFGEPGTNSQHAFFQLLHQGPDIIPVEFIVATRPNDPAYQDQHQLLLANCLAQSEALMSGRPLSDVQERMQQQHKSADDIAAIAPHRIFKGDRPSTSLIFETLDTETIGGLIALYEHRVFVEGVLWQINSFDQWGVELGKELAKDMMAYFEKPATAPAHIQDLLKTFMPTTES